MPETTSIPGILILRPEQQAQTTINAISAQGWQAIHFPTLEIVNNPNIDPGLIKSRIEAADWIIFISQNAVSHYLELVDACSLANKKIASVGQATTRLLEANDIKVSFQPENFSTEGLLASVQFSNVSAQNIVIVRGNGGREELFNTLKKRGATVDYLEVYERCLANTDPKMLLPLWPDLISVIVATSNQSLDNLLTLCKNTLGSQLYDKPLVVLSERMRSHARKAGFKKIWLAERSSNDEIINTIIKNMTSN